MPRYLYLGSERFINEEYGIDVKYNEEFTTKYVLPVEWTDFQLIDLNDPEPLLPYTESYTVDSLTEVDLTDYDVVLVLLKNYESAVLNVHCYSSDAKPIVLDNFVNFWIGERKSLYKYFDKIYLNPVSGTAEVTVYKGIIGSEYGGLGSLGSGGGGSGCTMSTSDPVPQTHGGLESGTVIQGWTPCQVLEAILFPYQYPSFTSFYIEGQNTQLEVGQVVTGGNRTFRWSTSHDENIQPNSITIRDVTASQDLIVNTDNDGTEVLDIGSDKTRTTPGLYTWSISGKNTKGGTFSRNFSVRWFYRVYWGYSDKDVLDANDVINLQNSQLKSGYSGTYNYTNSGSAVYYYVVYPDSWGDYNTWINTENGFGIDATMAGIVDVTNSYGVTVTYRQYRTTYLQNGDLNTEMN